MSGPVVWLVRHGRTALNAAGRFQGRTDPPLDEAGRAQAAALAARPPWGEAPVWRASTLRRAQETATVLAGGPVPADARFAELDVGELEGLTPAEGVARFPAFFEAWRRDAGSVRCPGGEALGDAAARAWAGLLELAAQLHPDGEAVVVGHQLVFAAVIARAHGEPPARWAAFRLEHAEAVPVVFRQGALLPWRPGGA